MTQPEISIRTIRESDLGAFKAIRLECLRTCPEFFGSDHDERAAEPESEWAQTVAKFTAGDEGRIFLAGGDTPVAVLGVVREPGKKSRHAALIWGVYVRPAARGQKLTERMFREALKWCQSAGVVVVRLTVNTRNVTAIRIYNRLGFQVSGVLPKTLCLDGVYHDELMMWRTVDPK